MRGLGFVEEACYAAALRRVFSFSFWVDARRLGILVFSLKNNCSSALDDTK
jgi:hypothetical protein